jgi:hypothetical protein
MARLGEVYSDRMDARFEGHEGKYSSAIKRFRSVGERSNIQ